MVLYNNGVLKVNGMCGLKDRKMIICRLDRNVVIIKCFWFFSVVLYEIDIKIYGV